MAMFKCSSGRILAVAVATILTTAAFTAVALAVAPAQTREGYVAQVEPICKKNTAANERILQGARSEIKAGRLRVAAGQFTRAGRAFEKAVGELRAVPPPGEDAVTLAKWLAQLEKETDFLQRIGKALNEGKKTAVLGLSVRLKHNGNLANNLVLDFDFRYCLINPSKFS